MQTLTALKPMLICPKCKKNYPDGSQRFCVNDGVRLNEQKFAQDSARTAGVFSGVLNKKGIIENEASLKPLPPKLLNQEISRNADFVKPAAEIKPEPPKTFTKLVKPAEIPSGQASLGDRKTNPVGRAALTADNPNILLGQTIKGRYFIKSRISQTAHSIKYLALDKSNADKKTIIRIYTGKLDGSDFSAKIYAVERVSLSHINHPNVAGVFDSGELPEGNPYLVSDYVKGTSLKEKFLKGEKFGTQQTARLIRQAADALGEVHQNGVLHRNLNPENIILILTDAATEQVKVTDFNIFSDKTRGDFSYLAPEQISGKAADFTADIYSLGVIAYRMLTGEMPFSALTSKELLGVQRKGLENPFSAREENISQETVEILRRALAFESANRFQSIRDFGDAFYKSLTSEMTDWDEIFSKNSAIKSIENEDFSVSLDSVLDETIDEKYDVSAVKESYESEPETYGEQIPTLLSAQPKTDDEIQNVSSADEPVELELDKPFRVIKFQKSEFEQKHSVLPPKKETDIPWERRSIEPPPQGGRKLTLISILGVILLFVLTGLIFYYFANRPAEQKFINSAENKTSETPLTQEQIQQKAEDVKNDINEIPPPPRKVEQPEGTVYFANSKENLSVGLLKNFRGFYLYYPNDWKINKFDKNRNKVDDKFIDISKNNSDGIPIEQFMVSFYDSRGTFELDKENFPAIVAQASEDIKKSPLPNFELIGSGLVNLNKADGYEGWKAYEMKFQGEGTALNGEKIKLFGRRFYIPAARPGVPKGLVVTLLATSLSKEITSADDLGTKGDLKTILSTFEPDQNF